MTENGRVKSLDKGGYAVVQFDRKTACENCRMCSPSSDPKRVEVRLKNSLNASVGDQVAVQMGDRIVLVSSLIVYIIPVIIVAVALLLTQSQAWYVSFAAAIGGAVFSLVIIALANRALRAKKGYLPVMTAIISDDNIDKEIKNG